MFTQPVHLTNKQTKDKIPAGCRHLRLQKRLLPFLMALISILGFNKSSNAQTGTPDAKGTTSSCGYEIISELYKNYPEEGKTTVLFKVRNTNDGNGENGTTQALSHWTMSRCFAEDKIANFNPATMATGDGGCDYEAYLGSDVLKFDYGTNEDKVTTYTLVLTGTDYSLVETKALFKRGTVCCPGTFWGVSCSPSPCDVTANSTSQALCEENPGGTKATFNLSDLEAVIKGNQTGVTVTWFEDKELTTKITENLDAYKTVSTTVYAKVTKGDCTEKFASAVVTLTVNPTPTATSASQERCADASDGTKATFNLSDLEATVKGSQTGVTVTWFEDKDLTTKITGNLAAYKSASTTVYAKVSTDKDCISSAAVTLTVNPTPTATDASKELCATEPGGTEATFDLTALVPAIVGDQTGVTVKWYTDADRNIEFDGNLNAYTTGNTTLYVKVISNKDCEASAVVTLIVNPTPTATSASQEVCADEPGGTIGTFNLSDLEAVVKGGQTDVTVTWYKDAYLKELITGNLAAYKSASTTVYAKVSSAKDCFSSAAVTLTVNTTPTANNASKELCSTNIGGTEAVFNLTELESTIKGSQANVTVEWYTDAAMTSNISTGLGAYNSGSTTLYVKVVSQKGCSASATVTLKVNTTPDCKITRTDVPNSTTTQVGVAAQFSAPAGNFTYKWELKNNTSGATLSNTGNQTVTVNNTSAGSYTLVLTVTTNASDGIKCSSTCDYTITVNPIVSVTYTQGFYGNNNGKTCDPKLVFSYQIMNEAVKASGGMVRFGNKTTSQSFVLKQADVPALTTANIYKMLPGGATPYVLKAANSFYSTATSASFDQTKTYAAVPMSSTGNINNNLLAQTMAFYFNLYYSKYRSTSLGDITITGNVLSFRKLATACGATYSNTTSVQTLPCTVFRELSKRGGKLANLLDIANEVLGGSLTTLSASDVNNALNIFNVGFDAGSSLVAMTNSSTCAQTTKIAARTPGAALVEVTAVSVKAQPNPFQEEVRFTITMPKAGFASLDLFDMLGQKVGVVFRGQLPAGTSTVSYTVGKDEKAGTYIYRLSTGNQQWSGKLIQKRF